MQVVVDFHYAHGRPLKLTNMRTVYGSYTARSIGCWKLNERPVLGRVWRSVDDLVWSNTAGTGHPEHRFRNPRWMAYAAIGGDRVAIAQYIAPRSEEHTSELQSLMRISYAVFCLKKQKKHHDITTTRN